MFEKNPYQLFNMSCLDAFSSIPVNSVDLVVTSPPYDGLRDYEGSSSDWGPDIWKPCIVQIKRILKEGGVCVWVVNDGTEDGSRTGTSFRQTLYAKRIGLRFHDCMIWFKGSFTSTGDLQTRYAPVFEYMMVWSKGKPKTFNPIKDRRNKHVGIPLHGTVVQKDGSKKKKSGIGKLSREFGQRFNIWLVPTRLSKTGHPAVFPEDLVVGHVLSWTNKMDVVCDPFMGSGTVGEVSLLLKRKFVGIEIEDTYFNIAKKRIRKAGKNIFWGIDG